jgi:hypothetical protein
MIDYSEKLQSELNHKFSAKFVKAQQIYDYITIFAIKHNVNEHELVDLFYQHYKCYPNAYVKNLHRQS